MLSVSPPHWQGNWAVSYISSPRRSLPRLLGSPCILQEQADGMYQKALWFPCCLSPWLGARTPLDQTWACGSCGSPFHCDTSPLYLTPQTDNTGIALNHPFSRINVYTAPFLKVTFAQLTVLVHPPALKTEVHVDWRASEMAPVLKSNTWARSYEQLHATKAPPLQFSFIWKGKMAFVLTSSSSKNLNSLPFWCCERGMYAMKAICSNSLEFFHEWTKRQKYFWKAKSENDQLEPCVHVLITGIH